MATAFALFTFFPFLLGVVALGFLALYVVLRWRDREDPVRDPQLGVKGALLFFRQLSLFLALAGATLVLGRLLGSSAERPPSEDLIRTGLALVVSNGLVWLAADRALARTNGDDFPRPARAFLGASAVLAGTVGIGALSVASAILFAGKGIGEAALPLAAAIVWGDATIVFVIRLLRRSPRGEATRPDPGPAA